MISCVFNNCPNKSRQMNKIHEIIFHTFPTCSLSKQEWINVVRLARGEPDWVPTKDSRVCALHFSPGHVFNNIRGEKSILRGTVPLLAKSDSIEEDRPLPANPEPVSVIDRNKENLQDFSNSEYNESVDHEEVVESNMDVPEDNVEVPVNGADNNVSTDDVQPVTAPNEDPNQTEEKRNHMPLDKFKRRLVRAVARLIKEKKSEEEMWKQLKKEIGCDCETLWHHMRALTLKKLKRLLPANDLLENLKKIARFTATDWLLFDLILVHEKVNVITMDGENSESENTEEPSCLRDLFELVKEHKVESLYGDDLIEAWIRVTLSYNSRGRQCSPMLLQLRWYQMKELTRARFYNFWCAYRGNHKILDRAMKQKPTTLQTEIASEYKSIITEIYPEWESLIEERRIILSEEFTLNRQAKRKEQENREENDVEIEVIEPQVETIDLEVESDEEHGSKNEKVLNTENSIEIEDNTADLIPNFHNNKECSSNSIDDISIIKSESDDEVLELDELSDVEEMQIPLENPQSTENYENPNENNAEIFEGIVSGTLPKITNVIGNVHEQTKHVIEEKKRIDSGDVTSDTLIFENQCLETEDTGVVQYESDSEINKILREKVNNLMNIEITKIKSECDPDVEFNNVEINTKTLKNLQVDKSPNSVNDPSYSGNKLLSGDSEDEIDKLIEEKANNYTSMQSFQSNFEDTEEKHHQKIIPEIPEIIEEGVSNEPVDRKIDEVVQEQETIKKENGDDDFDDVEFNDDLIEFLDDGIELVEEIEEDQMKNNDLEIEPASDSENESTRKTDDYPKIDVKLLMDPTVYTKKLDQMDIFKFIDYECVYDKKVIESAILESKPVDKLALKDEDIFKFREQAMPGSNTDGNQSDNDSNTSSEYTNYRVKCTSWMLQKPKNRTYNPIKLCKNPDFNTRLKRLTAGFFTSSRNRELLKECKPLTIDLHKAFENKLINGTMYLKIHDFKAAKCTTVDKIKIDPVSVASSVIPNQSMIFTTSTANDLSTTVPKKINDQEDSLSFVPTVVQNTSNERRKIINLPDIDQVRRVNQSLLTAEVTPIRIDDKINNTDICIEPEKASIVEPEFVQPIVVSQIKNEPFGLNLDDKNKVQLQLDKPLYEPSSRQDLMANKITDQIINLSSQISEVEKNDLLGVGVEKTPPKPASTPKKVGRKPNSNKKGPQPVHKYVPKYKCNLTWTPKYPKNHIADSLLTLDTLSKILFLLNGNEDEIKCACKKKKFRKFLYKHLQNDSIINQSTNDANKELQFAVPKDKEKNIPVMKDKNVTVTKDKNVTVTKDKNIKGSSTNNTGQTRTKGSCYPPAPKKRIRRPRTNIIKKYSGTSCCWAREKMLSSILDKPDPGKHECLANNCQCCCRQQLITWAKWKEGQRKANASKNIPSTIVLSDDDDETKVSEKSQDVTMSDAKSNKAVGKSSNLGNKLGTTSIVIGQSNQVTFESLFPVLATITKNTMSINAAKTDANNITIQSKTSQECSNNNVREISHQETDFSKKPKLCKTVVYSAPRYNQNLNTENSSDAKDKNSSDIRASVKTSSNIYKVTPKQIERTLYLNSKILNKPTKSPIYLGKNTVLLCSLKNSSVAPAPINYSLPVLPYGVNFVMLPNGELTISVDNGVQLDAEQFSTLSELMATVQEKYLKSNISSKVPDSNNVQQEIDDINTIEENKASEVHITQNIENQSTKTNNSSTDDKDKNAQSELSSPNVNDVNNTVSLPMDCENEASSNIIVTSEIMNTESECLKSAENPPEIETQVGNQITDSYSTIENQVEIEIEIETQVENQITDSHSTIENQVNVSQTAESVIEPAETSLNDYNDICKNITDSTRKTILSDLMEMSGISAEDTKIVSEESSLNITPLPPNIIPVTRLNGSGMDTLHNPTNSKVPDNISIAGPYSNLTSFEPNTPLNHLLNCIAQIRPELNAVTSFAELKYVYANDGYFYKLEVDSGNISEIKVLIKKNPKSDISTTPKAYIDLTDDICDEDNVTCAEFQDIPQDKQRHGEVKPIKLFKALHPAILRRTGRSILKENEVAYPKKPIHINKQRRKQLLNVGNEFVLIDVEKTNQSNETEDPPVRHLDSSYDTSDEEPLAKKRKHNQPVEEDIEEPIPLLEETIMPRNLVTEEMIDTPNCPTISGENGDMSDLEINSMDIEGVNPELHPVAFEEGSESDEDNCILGV